jgi:outer membrane protein assembly factor BamA
MRAPGATALAACAVACLWAAPALPVPRVERVDVTGNRLLSGAEVRSLLGVREGAAFDSVVASAGLDALLARYRDAGRLDALARVRLEGDSARVRVVLEIEEGPRARVAGFEVLGAAAVDWDEFRSGLELRPGAAFSAAALERDVMRVLAEYADRGRPYAAVRPQDFQEGVDGLRFHYVVEEGPPVRLDHFEAEGNTRTRAERVVRQAGLRPGEPYRRTRVEHAAWRLRRLGAFDRAEAGLLAGGPSGTLRYRVREGGTSSAQGVLGYATESHTVTGLFDLQLQNLGGGRAASFRLDARGGGVTEYTVGWREPLVFGTPLTLDAGLAQHLEDTLYTQSSAHVGVQAEVFPYAMASLAGEWERVGASVGPTLRDRTLQLRVALEWDRRDDPLAPTRGVFAKLRSSLGSRTQVARADGAVTSSASLREDELEAEAYVRPSGPGRVLALHAFVRGLRSDEHPAPVYRQFTLGGATTLRGYREQQFRGPVVGLASAEYRLLMGEPGSYVFVFAEAGFVRLEREAPGGVLVTNLVRPGYGMGLRVPTRLGQLGVDYAWGESVSPLGGKIHVSVRSRF